MSKEIDTKRVGDPTPVKKSNRWEWTDILDILTLAWLFDAIGDMLE